MEKACIFYGPLEYFTVLRYIFPRFGKLCQEKSGNPGFETSSLVRFENKIFPFYKNAIAYYLQNCTYKYIGGS
jgi:hypothetical protein